MRRITINGIPGKSANIHATYSCEKATIVLQRLLQPLTTVFPLTRCYGCGNTTKISEPVNCRGNKTEDQGVADNEKGSVDDIGHGKTAELMGHNSNKIAKKNPMLRRKRLMSPTDRLSSMLSDQKDKDNKRLVSYEVKDHSNTSIEDANYEQTRQSECEKDEPVRESQNSNFETSEDSELMPSFIKREKLENWNTSHVRSAIPSQRLVNMIPKDYWENSADINETKNVVDKLSTNADSENQNN